MRLSAMSCQIFTDFPSLGSQICAFILSILPQKKRACNTSAQKTIENFPACPVRNALAIRADKKSQKFLPKVRKKL